MLKLSKDDEVIIFRSAGIGDFLVIVPFINYLINIVGISEEKIHFVIINNQNLNPLKLIFENSRPIVDNSVVLNPGNILSETKKIKIKYKEKSFTKTIYLPFMNEPYSSKIKKLIAIKLIAGLSKKIYGLNFKKQSNNIGTQYLTYFEQLALNDFDKYIDFNITDILTFNQKEIDNINMINIDSDKKNIALYINSKLEMKIWGVYEFYKTLCYLKENYDVNIYLIGGGEDFEYNEKFINKFNITNVYNIAGKLSIRETISFFNKMDLLIANDGAPVHMAAYSSCAILGIYTYKEEVGSWEPYKSDRFITYRKNISCKHCYLEFCKEPFCLQRLKFIDISYSIDRLLTAKNIKQSIVVY